MYQSLLIQGATKFTYSLKTLRNSLAQNDETFLFRYMSILDATSSHRGQFDVLGEKEQSKEKMAIFIFPRNMLLPNALNSERALSSITRRSNSLSLLPIG